VFGLVSMAVICLLQDLLGPAAAAMGHHVPASEASPVDRFLQVCQLSDRGHHLYAAWHVQHPLEGQLS
jgi:hypothetical protein